MTSTTDSVRFKIIIWNIRVKSNWQDQACLSYAMRSEHLILMNSL